MVYKALDCQEDIEFQMLCNLWLDAEWTYIFEVTSAENRVVKKYDGYALHYLASRHNATGEYGDDFERDAALTLGARAIKEFKFDSVEECISTAKELTDLDEGYVVYQEGVPVCKVKSPAYFAVHAIRGEGLTPKRIMQLVLMNEQDEYLTYFPEDKKYFVPYIAGLGTLLIDLEESWKQTCSIESQKDFALQVRDWNFSAVLFQARAKNADVIKTFHGQRESYKIKLLEDWVSA
ncbi:RNA ligase [compost metagenome]